MNVTSGNKMEKVTGGQIPVQNISVQCLGAFEYLGVLSCIYTYNLFIV